MAKATKKRAVRWYSVFGIYKDNNQRYATIIQAADPADAERIAQEKCANDNKMFGNEPLFIAAVIEGKHKAKDQCPVYGGG
jgi:hypothetical protein